MHQRRLFTVSVMTYLTERLTRSWTITATSHTATRHLRRWQTRHPELADLATVAELAETIRATDRPTANQLVTILLREAAAGDRLAHETILNALRYLAIGVWRTHTTAGQRLDDDALCDVLADTVDIIAELATTGASPWPIRQLWNRLECRARRRHQRHDQHQRQTGDWDTLTPGDDDTPEDTLAAPIPRLDPGTELLAVLAHAIALGTITTTEATTIANKGLLDRPIATLAVARGCSTEAVQKNHRRVVQRLRAASADIADSYLTAADLVTAA